MMKLVMVDGTPIHTDNKLRMGYGIHGRGEVTRKFDLPRNKSMCQGCYDDFYNGEGAAECWCFKSSVVCNKVGYSSIHVANGPDIIMEKTLNCWHGLRK